MVYHPVGFAVAILGQEYWAIAEAVVVTVARVSGVATIPWAGRKSLMYPQVLKAVLSHGRALSKCQH